MADNVSITPGTGAIIATDDVAGVQYQRVKLGIGADGLAADLTFGQSAAAGSLPVVIASNQSAIPVSGTVAVTGALTDAQLRATAVPVSNASLPLPAGASTEATLALIKAKTDNIDVLLSTRTKPADTQPVSAASLPLPTGASTAAKQPAIGVAGTASTDVITVQGIASGTPQPVSGTVGVSGSVAVTGPLTDAQLRAAAVPISAAALPLPTGAATLAKQPALGTAGTAAADVITVQGIASMTALKVDGSAVTQPVSGTVTANAGTNLNTSALALDASIATLNTSVNTLLKPANTLATVTTVGTVSAVTAITNALPTGANVIGKVSIDQTTPGTTNKVDIADSLNNPVSAFPATFLRVTDEPRQLFYDAFDTAIDTTNRWTVSSGNSAVAASNTTGVMSMGSGTVASGWSKLVSQPTFTLTIPAWLGASDAIALPDGAAPTANSYRYWGTGTTPATPSVATPVTDGYGFELNTDGKLRAVVYAGGTRTVIADLSSSGTNVQPLDAIYHRYIIYIRTDKTYFYIDGLTSAQLVATANFQSSQVQNLPRLMLAIGNTTPPVSNTQIQCTGATAWDTGKNHIQLADGTFPWRKAAITSTGSLANNLAHIGATTVVTGGVNGTLGVGGLAASGAAKAGNPNQTGGVFNTTQPTVTTGQAVETQMTARGAQIVATGVDAFNAINTPVTPTTLFTNSAATTNATSVKGSAGTVWSIHATNINAAARFLKLYNKATAPTVGTDVPVLTIQLPLNCTVAFVLGGSNGIRFSTGIAFAITAVNTDADTTAVAVKEIKVAVTYT